jgi:tetrahydromethanopterin S-methyltransferase subunit F
VQSEAIEPRSDLGKRPTRASWLCYLLAMNRGIIGTIIGILVIIILVIVIMQMT